MWETTVGSIAALAVGVAARDELLGKEAYSESLDGSDMLEGDRAEFGRAARGRKAPTTCSVHASKIGIKTWPRDKLMHLVPYHMTFVTHD